MKRATAVVAVLVTLALAGCDRKRADNKGRPIPERTVVCWDGTTPKDVGPWTCDEHGGKVERRK